MIGVNKKKNYTLKEIGEHYFSKIEFQGELTSSKKSELKKVERTWNRFCKSITVKTILEVNKSHINEYYNSIYKEYQKGKSTTWIRGFFERVKRVLNAAIKDFDHPDDIIEVLRLCRNKLETSQTNNPEPSIPN